MNLWLVRHARVPAGGGVCYGRSDLAADALDTQAAAAALAASLPPCRVVRSSPLGRCRQLAQALAQLRPDLAASPDPRIAEFDFGRWEGCAWEAVPRDEFDRWDADFAAYRFGGQDSVAELLARVMQAIGDLPVAGDALWITHAGVIRAVRLIGAGGGLPRQAQDWPVAAVPFGGCECVRVEPARVAKLGRQNRRGSG